MSKEQIEEMIETIKKCSCVYTDCEQECSQCSNEELYDEALNHIARTFYEAGYRKQEWISVDERLPDHCGLPVLMVAVNSYNQIRVVKGFTDYQCPITFHTNEREYDSVWAAWEVTHWMPLPEPPKTEGGAE